MRTVPVLLILFVLSGVFYFFVSHKSITKNYSTPLKPSVTIDTRTKYFMKVTSTAFADHQTIPSKYTCDGENINPPFSFSDVPKQAKSLVFLMDDPDVPKNLKPDGVFDHWVVYNIDPETKGIVENTVPQGVSQGLNGAGQEKYTGPCPPDREHRYFFRLYALDTSLTFPNPQQVTKQQVIDAMQGHIMEKAELVGLYDRPANKQ